MQYLSVFFFGGRCNIFTLPSFRGRCSPSHTHIHISRTLANFFPDTFLTSGGFYPKPIYETNVAFFVVFFILVFCSPYPSFSKKYFQTF